MEQVKRRKSDSKFFEFKMKIKNKSNNGDVGIREFARLYVNVDEFLSRTRDKEKRIRLDNLRRMILDDYEFYGRMNGNARDVYDSRVLEFVSLIQNRS